MQRMLTMLAGVAWALSAQAQIKPVDTVSEKTLTCLERTAAPITYPERDLAARLDGRVRLSLRFSAPDRAPEIDVLYRTSSEEMLDEVRWHVRGYRVPCMKPGAAPVTAVQEFSFTPRQSDPISWSPPRAQPVQDEDTAKHEKDVFACLRAGKPQPEYSGSLMSREATNAVVQMQFKSADDPPEVKLVYSSLSPTQHDAVLDYVRGYRVPCLAQGAQPVTGRQHFHFSPPNAEPRVFKDAVPLMSFLSSIKGIRSQRADFDFQTMSCPFQVAWEVGRPALASNEVGQVGKSDPNRTEFLAWLASLEMDLKPRNLQALLGQSLIINVPCGRLLLEPKN
jgi:hypothetical protein